MLQDETSAWEIRLANLQDGLALLNVIQRKWVYLEPIFARGALPQQQVLPPFLGVGLEMCPPWVNKNMLTVFGIAGSI